MRRSIQSWIGSARDWPCGRNIGPSTKPR
jgi:hypothetical protein